ncbi:MAG TPA: hypothetical protein VH599_00200 [Ktedonobacterales bacterium]|jgi:hypothetical protein
MSPALLLAPSAVATPSPETLFLWEALLDLAGVIAAIWTLWAFVWLPLKGIAMSAFRLIAVGGLIFALLHVLDTLFQVGRVLPRGLPTLVHFGLVLVAMVYFLLGLARLADALEEWKYPEQRIVQQHWWPLVVGLALVLGATSFIIYGFSLLAVVWASFAMDAGIILLSVACGIQVRRAHLGGAVGGALWLALAGLLIFSLAHPVQTWGSVTDIVAGPLLPLVHRLVVIPAFLLFSASITRLSRALAPQIEQRASMASGGAARQASYPPRI